MVTVSPLRLRHGRGRKRSAVIEEKIVSDAVVLCRLCASKPSPVAEAADVARRPLSRGRIEFSPIGPPAVFWIVRSTLRNRAARALRRNYEARRRPGAANSAQATSSRRFIPRGSAVTSPLISLMIYHCDPLPDGCVRGTRPLGGLSQPRHWAPETPCSFVEARPLTWAERSDFVLLPLAAG